MKLIIVYTSNAIDWGSIDTSQAAIVTSDKPKAINVLQKYLEREEGWRTQQSTSTLNRTIKYHKNEKRHL